KALVLDRSYLILDPKLQEYHLIVSLYSHLPEIFFYEHTTLELKNWALSRTENAALQQELGIRKAALTHFMDSASKALGGADPSNKIHIEEKNKNLEWEAGKLRRWLENPSTPKPAGKDSVCFPARSASLAALTAGTAYLSELNESRIQSASGTMGSALILSIVFWILSLILILASLGSYLRIRSDMLGVISVQKRALDAAQKLATLGELSGSIGHDIGNPLMVIESVTSVIERMYQEQHPEILSHTHQLHRMVDRIEAIIRSLKNLMSNKRQEVAAERVRMKNVFEDVELLVQHRARIHATKLIFDLPDQSFDVMGNESDFIQVFVNLICNAIDAVKTSVVREVRVTLQDSDELLRIFVADSGPGVPADLRTRVFEPLFTTKPKGEGTGLGLAICQKLVTSHGGKIEIIPTQTGACFQVTFKKAQRPA
ncbi:MAG: GHKL domain-containing protein, partial [Spirochaetia bacterium]|nr:GHKL domain-containing protein [Spirochaetia bacterium]